MNGMRYRHPMYDAFSIMNANIALSNLDILNNLRSRTGSSFFRSYVTNIANMITNATRAEMFVTPIPWDGMDSTAYNPHINERNSNNEPR